MTSFQIINEIVKLYTQTTLGYSINYQFTDLLKNTIDSVLKIEEEYKHAVSISRSHRDAGIDRLIRDFKDQLYALEWEQNKNER